MSGTLYALAADPLVRAYLAKITMDSSRLALFADGIAVAMRELTEAMQPLLELKARWRRAAGQALKPEKCSVIVVGRDLGPCEEFMKTIAPEMRLPLVRLARYLGMEIGPSIAGVQ